MSDLGEMTKKRIRENGLPIIDEARTKAPLYVSMRELPLRFQFGTTKIQKFFDGLKEGKIYMTQCEKCTQKYFPPQADCPNCPDSSMNWVPLDGQGELLTCTMIVVKPSTFAHYDNYIIGVAQMKEGVRVLAWLRIDDPRKITPKMKVRLTTAKREPEGFITYEFVPE
ncbi:MAG: Zn-ribbon domain-containing OB-fold protein [Candidatus Bathyarchaeota archaeon]|nr:MAG: Zn-ribbon domain-containing OB-fold protein [Candidatus Bathyarchaeota archaeon]